MPAQLTDITEITTALGMVAQNLSLALARRPAALTNVDDEVWARLQDSFSGGKNHDAFCAAFGNGQAFLAAKDGLRNRILDRAAHLRLRIDSAWDWQQAYELRALEVAARHAGQPEVA